MLSEFSKFYMVDVYYMCNWKQKQLIRQNMRILPRMVMRNVPPEWDALIMPAGCGCRCLGKASVCLSPSIFDWDMWNRYYSQSLWWDALALAGCFFFVFGGGRQCWESSDFWEGTLQESALPSGLAGSQVTEQTSSYRTDCSWALRATRSHFHSRDHACWEQSILEAEATSK